MNFRITVISALSLSISLGQTLVSGPVSGTWTSRDSPYQLTADAVVESGDSLILEAGVRVELGASFELKIQGDLSSSGSSFHGGERIFCDEGSLHFNNTSFIELNGGVYVSGGRAEFLNCLVEASSGTGITFANADSSVVKDSQIRNSGDYGVKISQTDLVEITGNIFQGNSVNDLSHPALFIDSCSPQLIEENIIDGNHAQGIGIWTLTSTAAPLIRNNLIRRNFTGITIVNSPANIEGNIIVANYEAGNTDSGAGIFAGYPNTTGIVRNNYIAGNYYGISNINNAALNLGDMVNDYPGDDGENIFSDNSVDGVTWHIWNSTSNQILAQNNYWPGMDMSDVDATLWDDEEGGGEILFQPIYVANLPVPPDVNSDDLINILDVIVVIETLLVQGFPSALDFYLSDINGDFDIDVSDVVTIIDLVIEN